jgi:hypothetical protein
MTDTEKSVVVDDRMVGSYFGVTSYDEFEIFTGPYGRDYPCHFGESFEWRENHSEECKRQVWEETREQIQDELLGLRDPWYTKDGKVVPFIKKPVTFLDWLRPCKEKVYKLPVDPLSKVVSECLVDTPGKSGTIIRCRIVDPTDIWNGGVNGWYARYETIFLNRYTRLMYMSKWIATLVWAKLTGKRLTYSKW